ncbi:F0F1 ATP synthase subunit A [Aeromicrobium sp.]|nr:F0F1 ATP synthase subunit A [Candidatus Saccharibacteria bacterium]
MNIPTLNFITRFAADDGPAIHVAPAEIFHVGGVAITNSILYGWISITLITIALVAIARKVTLQPKGGAMQMVEAGADFISSAVVDAFTDKSRGRKYVPFFVTVFFFILLNNWFGLIPGVGEAIQRGENPVLRPFTADLNGTLAIGIFTMVYVYFASIRESGGIVKYFKHFFLGSPLNPLYLVIGILEIFTDLTRTLSLSLRLFLNVTIGEIVIAVFAYLGHAGGFVTALPFTLVELFIGALQAYIFTVLSLQYLAITVNHATEHDNHDLTEDEPHETIGVDRDRVGEATAA